MTADLGKNGTTYPPDWEEGSATDLISAVGRQIRLWRERAGMTQPELGKHIGYSNETVSSVERGRRVPKPEFLDAADEATGAGGLLKEFKKDVERARIPQRVRDIARLEDNSVSICNYGNHNIAGLLQTEDYARALYQMRRPLLDEATVERYVAGRMARQGIFSRSPAPTLSFVQEEVTLLRPLGGRVVMRGQLERLLEVGQLRNVEIQVMPTDREDHAGMGGGALLLGPKDGPTVGIQENGGSSRLVSNRDEVRTLETQYGIIRAQALTPRESLTFIEKVLGET
ncbi:helix-turn-helix domain-containing protein [Streptomyces sp. NPDC004031]